MCLVTGRVEVLMGDDDDDEDEDGDDGDGGGVPVVRQRSPRPNIKTSIKQASSTGNETSRRLGSEPLAD